MKSLKDEALKLRENIDKVYEAGEKAGEKAGAKSEYDTFWKQYQSNGAVYGCAYMFAFGGWNDTNFKPKYSMSGFTNAMSMFNTCAVTDLKAALERQGVTFNFSKVSNFGNAFAYSKLTVIPTVNTRSATILSGTFSYSDKIHTIEKLVLKDDGSQTFSNTFLYCQSLANIVIEGVIGKSIDFKSCPLTVESMKNIIAALKNYTGTTSANSYTVKFSDSCWATLEADSKAPNGDTWKNYVFNNLCWNY